jgi:phenylacetate-CoA ligase
VRSAAGSLLSLVPADLVYGKTYRRLRADIARSTVDAGFVEDRVLASLSALLARAATTPHYAEQLAGLEPSRATLADLASLPILTREIVRHDTDRMLAVPRQRLEESMTSGTSAPFLRVYLDKSRSVREWAFVTHAWAAAGYRLGDRRAVLRYNDFRGARSDHWSWEPGTRELRFSPFHMAATAMEEYLDLIERFRIAFIHGYPSAIALLARHAHAARWPAPPSLKGVLPISESLLPHQREIIRRGFGPLPIVPFYGLTEKVAFAREVPDMPDVYEFEPLYGVAEIVDDQGRSAAPGQRGRLIGTGFISTGMPFIRYDTGDVATVVRPAAAENCWRLRVRDLVSINRQQYLVTREGGLVTAWTAYPYNTVVREYQWIQQAPGRVTLRVVPEPGASEAALVALAEEVAVMSGGMLTADLEVLDEIPPTSRGKRLTVLQHLDVSRYLGADHDHLNEK